MLNIFVKMPVTDSQTESHILDTATRVFFAEGRIYATVKEIADAAGLSRTLINYYFRSKKLLIEKVVKKTLEEFKQNSDSILLLDIPFREKTELFIDDFLNNQFKYPYLESFVAADLIRQEFKKSVSDLVISEQPVAIRHYIEEIQREMDKGTIVKSNPVHFMMNMFSMMVYPVMMRPLQQSILNLTREEYRMILKERKQVITDTLFHPVNNK